MLAHLIPLGRDRYELYAEPPDVDDGPLTQDASRVRRWLRTAGDEWQRHVDAARLGTATSRIGKWRDGAICRLAESLDEQRTLRALRTEHEATMLFPGGLTEGAARTALNRILAHSRTHHSRRLTVYLLLFIVSGIIAVLPGPNIVAYYLGFQAFGHLQAWRGARHASSGLQWRLTANTDLEDLARLTALPHAARAVRVESIAARLDLHHLAAFFERAAT